VFIELTENIGTVLVKDFVFQVNYLYEVNYLIIIDSTMRKLSTCLCLVTRVQGRVIL
jgi:hypothetical protein